MLSISSGHSAEYLTGQVAQGRESYYLDATTAGEPPGRWWGTGAEAFGLTGEVDHDVMAAIYGDFRDPRDPAFADPATRHEAARLGRAPRRDKTEDELVAAALAKEPAATAERRREIELEARKHARKSVQFIDATFSPVKSVTVLHTALQRAELDAERAGDEHARDVYAGMRADVEAALWAGNDAMLETLTERAGFSRAGRHAPGAAGRWIDAHDWTVASFHQSDSRDHDPQQHIHNAILNRVVCEDGQVRTLDSRAIHRWKQSAGAIGERVMEEELSRRLGVKWVDREDREGREVAGIDQAVMDLFSERAAHISRGLAERVREFEQAHGRAPTALELSRLQQRVKLATRKAKTHAGETAADRLDRWDRELRAEVAGGLTSVAESVRAQAQEHRARGGEAPVAEFSPEGVIAEAVAACQAKRPTFTASELDRQILLRLPPLGGMNSSDIRELVERLRDQAITDLVQINADLPGQAYTPSELRLSTGQSAHVAPGAATYATRDHVAAEQALRRAAVERGRMAVDRASADAWLAKTGSGALSPDQKAAVGGILTSGAAVSVLVGPAGTGKSHTMGVFADAWSRLTGGRVVGVATSQIATDVLTEDGLDALNTTRWVAAQRRLAGGEGSVYDEEWRLTDRDVVVVDEASMVDTDQLTEIRRYADAAGARVVLTGDPRQLAAVGAGGAMGMLTGDGAADVHTLAEVRRFTDENAWERDASLALRDGDQAAVLEYDRRGRIVDGGTIEQAAYKAADAYVGDVLDGKSSVVVTASNDAAAQVAGVVRDKLVALGVVDEDGLVLRDRNPAGVGDLIQARRNDWSLGVVNRRRYRVQRVNARDESLEVVDDDGTTFTLPAEYVREHVTLAYASTAHACQGITVDTSHVVTSQQTSAEGFYVGMSRGRESNTAWVTTLTEQPGAETGETHARERAAATAVVAGILDEDDRGEVERSALDQAARAAADADNMRTISALREQDVHEFVWARLGRHLDELAADGRLSEDARAALAADQATTQLAKLLRAVEQAGHDPREALSEAVARRGFDGAESVAKVLHHRVSLAYRNDLVPVRDPDAHGMDVAEAPAEWNAYLAALDSAAEERRRVLGSEVAADPQPWALTALGPVPDDPVDRAEWERTAGVIAAYRESADWTDESRPLGPAPGLMSTERRVAWHEAWNLLGRPEETIDEAAMADGALRARWRAWERAQEWAPVDVHDQLRATSWQIEEQRRAAARADQAASVADDPDEAERHRAESEHARQMIEVMTDVRDGLNVVADARAQWQVETAWTRELADRAYRELDARGVPVGAEPDRVDPAEWLAAQRAAEAEEEAHRVVTEADVVDVDAADRAAVDEVDGPDPRAGVVEVESAAAVDEPAADSGYDGPELPAGVPTPVEVTAATTRAAAVVDEYASQRSAEDAHTTAEEARAQAELDASMEHHYRERERAAAEAAEREQAPVWEL